MTEDLNPYPGNLKRHSVESFSVSEAMDRFAEGFAALIKDQTTNDEQAKYGEDLRWYVWTCSSAPWQLEKGTKPMPPYACFETESEAWDWLEARTSKRRPAEHIAAPGKVIEQPEREPCLSDEDAASISLLADTRRDGGIAVRDWYEAKIASGELITKAEHERLLIKAIEDHDSNQQGTW